MGGMFIDHGGRKGQCRVTNIILVVSATKSWKLENYFLAKKKIYIYIYTEFSFRIMVKLKFLIKTFDEKNLL